MDGISCGCVFRRRDRGRDTYESRGVPVVVGVACGV